MNTTIGIMLSYIVVLLIIIGQVTGQRDCVIVSQVGESVIHEQTTLMCNISLTSSEHFRLHWYGPYNIVSPVCVIKWTTARAIGNINITHPDKHDCKWNASLQQSVLTIKNTNITTDDGKWRCRYTSRSSPCIIGRQALVVDVTGLYFDIFTVIIKHQVLPSAYIFIFYKIKVHKFISNEWSSYLPLLDINR